MDCMRGEFEKDVILGDRFKTISPLNHGTFGMVFKARDLDTSDTVAIKCLTRKIPDGVAPPCPAAMSVDERSEEVAIHTLIGDHPNIVNLVTSFETRNHAYLVLEYCENGDLYEAISAGRGPLETKHVQSFMLELVDAVSYLHEHGVAHRDIKPENIFLTRDGSLKLGDFGLATTDVWNNETGVGSDRYMAPEQYDCVPTSGYAPAAADIWAVGICLLNILFGRNPFANPTQSDPLFADFVRDRQSLFDVFPNMSQDTYNVLVHCLAIDPAKRSLDHVRRALDAVVSFTTDDEDIDDFCTGKDVVGGATEGREPLRTPSISSPQPAENGSFPWAKALGATPQKAPRQLSVIRDEDDMYPAPTKADPEVLSLASALDSGIGMSYKSSNLSIFPTTVPTSTSTSLPARSLSHLYADKDFFSKSWSDLCEEEEDEKARSSLDLDAHYNMEQLKAEEEMFVTRSSTPAIDIKPSSRGSSTPRMLPLGASNSSSRCQSPERPSSRFGCFQLGNFGKSTPGKDAPIKRNGSFLMDKWAALGNLRRNNNSNNNGSVTAVGSPRNPTGQLTPVPAKALASSPKPGKDRERASSWRKRHNNNQPFANKSWNESKDWRSPHKPPYNYTLAPDPQLKSRDTSPSLFTPQQRRKSPRRIQQTGAHDDDIGDLEWVGGWHDLQT